MSLGISGQCERLCDNVLLGDTLGMGRYGTSLRRFRGENLGRELSLLNVENQKISLGPTTSDCRPRQFYKVNNWRYTRTAIPCVNGTLTTRGCFHVNWATL